VSGIFISYRRDDSGEFAHRLYRQLEKRFPETNLFIDVHKIAPAANFAEVLAEKVGFADVLIAVIGRTWTTITSDSGNRRLDDPDDWVRMEISDALNRATPVIPLLVTGAESPSRDDLPACMAGLAELQALSVRQEHFDDDVDQLADALADFLKQPRGLALWLSIIRRGYKALDPLDLHRPEVLRRGLLFLACAITVQDIFHLPGIAAQRDGPIGAFFFVSYVAANYVEWITAGVVLHAFMRWYGGRGSLHTSIAAFCFLSAYLPLISLAEIPAWSLSTAVLAGPGNASPTPMTVLTQIQEFVRTLNVFGYFQFVASFIVATTLWVLFLRSVIGAFRVLHRLDLSKTVQATLVSLVAYLAFLALFYHPLVHGAFRL
jgi:hypothetical protein